MFGINLGEFTVIAVIALIVIGPERLPRYAEQLGRLVREGRKMALGLREQVREEIGPEFDDVDWRKLDPRQYDPRRIVKDALKDTFEDDVKPTSSTSGRSSGSARAPRAPRGAGAIGGAAAATAGDATTGDAGAPAPAADATPSAPYDSDAT